VRFIANQTLGIHAKLLDALCYRWLACEPLSALCSAIRAEACLFVCLGGDGPRSDELCEFFVADVLESHGSGISQNSGWSGGALPPGGWKRMSVMLR
jgi:hypothetical protein